jgi:hypothetical protein
MKRRDFVRHLREQGCVLVREGRSHTIVENPANGRRSPARDTASSPTRSCGQFADNWKFRRHEFLPISSVPK